MFWKSGAKTLLFGSKENLCPCVLTAWAFLFYSDMEQLIKNFDFNGHNVRIITNEEGRIYFVAKDVCDVLGYSNSRDAIAKHCKKEGVANCDTPTESGIQQMTVINEGNLYRLVLKSRKKEAAVFESWVCDEVLPSIRKTGRYEARRPVQDGDIEDFRKHLYVETQKDYSKKINSKNFNSGGVEKTIEYNRKNCKLHTGKLPNEIVSLGKSLGLKSNQRTSAKEVIRNLKPELACSMSFTDKLVCENNINHEEACKTSLQLAQPLFKKLMDLGINAKQLEG